MATKTDEIWIGEDDARRKLEDEELQAFLAERETMRLEFEQAEAQVQAKLAAKAALLERLGITAEEAALLLYEA